MLQSGKETFCDLQVSVIEKKTKAICKIENRHILFGGDRVFKTDILLNVLGVFLYFSFDYCAML